MKNRIKKYDTTESLVIGIVLNIVGGILDCHTYLFRHKIFANTQTGNVVFLALAVSNNEHDQTLRCLLSLVSFILGIFVSEIVKKIYINSNLNFTIVVLIIEIIFLSFLSLIPKNCLDNLVTSTISFVCAVQTNSFRSLKGSPYASTMCTGNLRSASANFLNYVIFKNKKSGLVCLQFIIIIFSFFFGIIAGKFLTDVFQQKTYLFCCTLFLILLFRLFLDKFKRSC